MSADNYVIVRRFGPNDYRWGMWYASEEKPDYSDDRFRQKSYASPGEAGMNAYEVLGIIEYGINYEDDCLRQGD